MRAESNIPKVSVLIPIYNSSRFLGETIQSVLDQTFTDFELLLCDDCSTDDSPLVAQSFSDRRIKYFRNEKNLGNGETRNRLISLASGTYCAMLDNDDVCYRNRLRVQADYLDTHPDIDVCSGVVDIINEDSVPSGERYYSNFEGHERIRLNSLFDNTVANTSLMFRREKFISNGLKYENGPADDMSLFRDALDVLKFENLRISLVKYRFWSGQFSALAKGPQLDHAIKSIKVTHGRLGIEVGPEEEQLLRDTFDMRAPGNRLWDLRRYMLRMLKANRQTGYFSHHLLRPYLFTCFRKACKKGKSFGAKILYYPIYLSFKLKVLLQDL